MILKIFGLFFIRFFIFFQFHIIFLLYFYPVFEFISSFPGTDLWCSIFNEGIY